ncbi:hypothetical protein T440DRAFT_427681 [Plenodomus tracheiphilus IPT5]|uniref:Nephrocystin 3-like N-terminal domain-containing protein n=1 Tax=Plenodomus tracheiphilus IPT5 TaxID=1408161 RepID=A0A6A7B0D2_9PLEO|nr:hypothetical protein T440DRAFT_427681 [Plenodomus tracheiphilus IPT5]
MVDTSHDLHLFDEATEAIQATVLELHRGDFLHNASAPLLLNELQASHTNSLDHRLVVCSRKFALLVRNFAPYFDILTLCVQLRSEWPSWFWGSVRLIFKVGSNYPVFLDKVADMFETIAHIASPFRQIYDTCKRSESSSHLNVENHHLAALMSTVYADVVYLFLDLYRIFCREAPGYGFNQSTRGANQSVLWRPLDYRFARLESKLVHHRRWLEKETEGKVQNYAEVALRRREYVDFLNRQTEITGNDRADSDEQILARRIRRIDKARKWLLNGTSTPLCDNCRALQPAAGSCDWFFKTPAYCRWKDVRFDRKKADDINALGGDWQHRILFVQAREGFGKTTIAKEVAVTLGMDGEGLDPSDEPSATASFHFDITRPESSHASHAIHSLASQLLHTNRHDRVTLDAVCLLLRKTSFRERATTEEALDVLSLMLRQHATYLVVDGVDECSNIETFLASLAQACRKSDTRVVLFSRPNIKIPLEYQKWASDAPHIFTLTSEYNAATIEHYVAQSLNQMADQGFFGIAIDRTIIPRVAQVSNGELLWVRTLLNFLQSPLLSAEERYAILQNIHLLQGLAPLYRNILGVLERRSALEKRIMADAFRWLSFSIHSLSPSAMRAALSTIDKTSLEEVNGHKLINTLPELSCSLLHMSNESMVFVHRSVPAYLQASASQVSEFSLHNENNVHAQLAARCLSHLAHHVPQQPLEVLRPRSPLLPPVTAPSSGVSQRTNRSGDSGYKSLSSSDGDNVIMQPNEQSVRSNSQDTSMHTTPFDSHLPFLRYAALCWPIHLSRALSHGHHNVNLSSPESYPYLPALSIFLASRLAITVWVEASYHYNLPPSLSRLVGPLSDLKGEVSPATVKGKELRFAVNALRELSERLVHLKRECEGALRQNPSLIWQMEEVGEGAYWPVWEEVVNECQV